MTQLEVGGKRDGGNVVGWQGMGGDCAVIMNHLFSKEVLESVRSFYII